MKPFLNYLSDQFVFNNLKKITYGHLRLIDTKGSEYFFGDSKSLLKSKIKINNPNFMFELIKNGSSGLAESYINGDFETDNLSKLIELTAKNIQITHNFSGLLQILKLNSFKKFFLKNTIERSKTNISKHYDLGNDFFSLWLDNSLTYSCAIFDSANDSLEKAQINKYNKLINMLRPKAGSKILEIGCGWGGFAEHVAKNYDVNLECITISKKQYEFAKKRIYDRGLNSKVKIEMKDYRDVSDRFDAIASIEMIEAVGQPYLKKYFNIIKKNLDKNGIAAIQAIIIKDELANRYKGREDFIQKYIFPGGFLPSKKQISHLAKTNGLQLENINSYGQHYSDTLQIWKNSFFNSWEKISKQGFDTVFKKMWDFYLSYCEAGFKSKNIDLIQFSMSNK